MGQMNFDLREDVRDPDEVIDIRDVIEPCEPPGFPWLASILLADIVIVVLVIWHFIARL